MKKIIVCIFIFTLMAQMLISCSSSHQSLNQLVGNDRDEHGCLRSAGYQWSYALNDCVRIWERGERCDFGQQSVFLIYSPDSTFAEIYTKGNRKILCKRQKENFVWRNKKGKEYVKIANGVTTVHVDNHDFTKSTK